MEYSSDELYYSEESEQETENKKSENIKILGNNTFNLINTRHNNYKYTTTEYFIDFDKPNNKLYRKFINKHIRTLLYNYLSMLASVENKTGNNEKIEPITSGIMCYPLILNNGEKRIYWFIYRSFKQGDNKYTRLYRLNSKEKIEELPLNLFRTDAYIRIFNVIRLHQLIGLNFCPIDDALKYVKAIANKTKRLTNIDIDHIDGNKYNNNPSNLNITTHTENVKKTHNRVSKPCIYFIGDVKTLKPLRQFNGVALAYDYYVDTEHNIYKQFKKGYKQILLYTDNVGKTYYKLSKNNTTKSPLFVYLQDLVKYY